MRYHGTLIATALGKTVLSVDLHGHSHYTNKNRYIYEHYGIKGLSVKNSGLHKFNKAQYERLLASSGKTPDIKTLYIDASTQLHTMLTKLLNEGVE